jgi:Yeast cell wall synthesis protein KRE9/KNH1
MSAATGGTITNFSPRFSLTGMIGTFPPTVTAGLKTVSGTKGPATINQVSSPQVGAVNPAVAAGGAEFNVPYSMQTGAIRYAPMPIQPPTKISAKNFSPLFPTSAYTPFQTLAPPAQVATSTATAPVTLVVQSREATVRQRDPPFLTYLTFSDGRPVSTCRCYGEIPQSVERLMVKALHWQRYWNNHEVKEHVRSSGEFEKCHKSWVYWNDGSRG